MSVTTSAHWKGLLHRNDFIYWQEDINFVYYLVGQVDRVYMIITELSLDDDLRRVIAGIPGLHNKLLKPLAQGASRFEKLLARKKSYWPEKITGLNFRNQRRGLHTKHD